MLPAGVAAFVWVLLVFWPAMNAEFLNWDDLDTITQNQNFRGFTIDHLRWMCTTGHMGHYQPLAWLSFAIDHALWDMKPGGYHLTSVILHGISTVLVFVLSVQLMTISSRSSTASTTRDDPLWIIAAAFMAAMIFGIHPMRVESVVWITERRDVLSGVFAIACVIAYVQYARGDSTGNRWWYAASLVLFALALMSKAITLTLPAILVALDWYPLRRGLRARRVWIEKIPFVVLSAVITVVILNFQKSLMQPIDDHAPIYRIAQAVYGLTYYPRATLWPVELLPLYEFPRTFDPFAMKYVLGALTIAVALGVLIWKRRAWPGSVVGVVAYLVLVGPVLGLLQTGPQFVADRYSYLSLIGLTVVAAAGLRSLLERRHAAVRISAVVACATLLTTLGLLTTKYASQWKSSAALWSYTLRVEPNHAVAHACYGVEMTQIGDDEGADRHFGAALDLRPDMPEPAINLARAMMARNEIDAALAMYRYSLRFNPAHPELNRLTGDLLQRKNDYLGAIPHYETARRAGSDSMSLHNNFANALAAIGRYQEAVEHFRIALRMDPSRVQTYVNLALNLVQIDPHNPESRELLQHALRMEPDNPKVRAAIAKVMQAPASQPQ